MSDNTHKESGSAATAAWADHDNYEPETNINIPSEEAVEAAKEWVETNEL